MTNCDVICLHAATCFVFSNIFDCTRNNSFINAISLLKTLLI
jgi:hypothetical protein